MKKFNQVYRKIMESVKGDKRDIDLLKKFLKNYAKNLKYDKHAIRYIDSSSYEDDEISKIIPFSKETVDPTDKNRAHWMHQGADSPGDLIIWAHADGVYHLEINMEYYEDEENDDENYSGIVVEFDSKQEIVDFFKKNGATNLVSHL